LHFVFALMQHRSALLKRDQHKAAAATQLVSHQLRQRRAHARTHFAPADTLAYEVITAALVVVIHGFIVVVVVRGGRHAWGAAHALAALLRVVLRPSLQQPNTTGDARLR
jgi:hypothetical protein